jgi:hypothetical protein
VRRGAHAPIAAAITSAPINRLERLRVMFVVREIRQRR